MPDPLLSLIIGGVIAGIFLLIFWPEKGFFWVWQRAGHMTEHVQIEDALKHSHNSEINGHCPTIQSIAGDLQITVNQAANLVSKMEDRGLFTRRNGNLCLTPSGRQYALQIIRAHRLWERYLADSTGFSEAEWHGQAERYEHLLGPTEANALSAQLGNPLYDPHGDPIPTETGEVMARSGLSLTSIKDDQPVRIVHIEDEPEVVYAQLTAEGLHPGMIIRVTESTPHRIRFWADLDEHVLAPVLAANITVMPIPQEETVEDSLGERLSSLKPGQKGQIVHISTAYSRVERRRLMDLGLLRGTVIKAEMTSPGGDPTAYWVRDTLIALRKEQADLIYIKPLEVETVAS